VAWIRGAHHILGVETLAHAHEIQHLALMAQWAGGWCEILRALPRQE
jgi:hypothetical protein